jgi:MYXO-CTERM domain-containing protein
MKAKLLLGTAAVAWLGLLPSASHAQTVIISENFDAFPTCSTSCGAACVLAGGWTNVNTDDIDWATDAAGTPSSGTGPSVDHTLGNTTGRYLYTESSSPCFGDTAELWSPVFDISTATYPAARFWYHMYGQSQGALHVDLIRDPNNTAVRTNDVIPAVTDNRDLWQRTGCIPLDPAAGQFRVVIRGVTGADFYSDMAIDDFEVVDLPAVDLAVSNPVVTGACAGQSTIQANIANLGGANVSGFTMQYTVNGGAPVTETFSGTLLGCGATTVTFTTPTVVPAGNATITVSVVAAGDVNAANDSASTSQVVKPRVTSFPYQESFESGPGGWTTYGGNNPWQLGVPADDVINAAYDGTNAWVTNLAGDYPASAQGFIDGPCFDTSSVPYPRFEAYLWYEAEFSYDGAQVQISTDGLTWTKVGTVGEPTWYNDTTVLGLAFTGSQEGWTGRTNTTNGSGGWVQVGHDLGPAASSPTLRVRIAFGADTSVQDDGVAIDAIRIVNNPPRVELTDQSVANAGAFPAGSTNVRLQTLGLEAFGSVANITGLTLTKQGNLPDADITGVALLLDDGDGLPGPTDTALGGPQTFSAGRATFTFSAPVAVTPGVPALVWVMADLGVGAPAGLTFGTSVQQVADVMSPSAQVTLPNGPAAGPLAVTFGISALLPFADAFDLGPVANRQATGGPGVFPTAVAAGTSVLPSATTANPGFAILTDVLTVGLPGGGTLNITASSTPTMALLGFPLGQATAAIDWYFDLSSYDAATDDVFLMFEWNNVNQTDHAEDNIFVSLDGGVTWALSAFNFDFSTAVAPGWNGLAVNISAALRAAGLGFSANTVVRLQAAGDTTSAFMLDNVWAGVPAGLRVERVPGVPVASGANDDLGSFPGGVPQTVQYTLHNDGQTPLTVDPTGLAIVTLSNATLLGGPTSLITIPPGGAQAISFTLQVTNGGPFQVSVTVPTNDPRLANGVYALNIVGVGFVEPDIAVTLADGTAVASGQSHPLGTPRAGAQASQGYIIANVGGGPLSVTSATVQNAVNVTAAIAPAPAPTVASGGSTPFIVTYTPTAPGAFSYEVAIVSDDPDTAIYTVGASGTAVSPDIAVSRAGTNFPNGGSDGLGPQQTGVMTQLTYTIANSGDAELLVSGVTLQGATNVTAAVSTAPTATVAAGGSATFVVDVTPTADGAFSFGLVIASDDPDEGSFAIAVDGVGFTPAPELTVTRGGTAVPNGTTEEAGSSAPGSAQVWTYTLANEGTADLVLSGPVTVANASNAEASVTQQPSTTIAAGGTGTLVVTYSATAPGAFSFDVLIGSNDADEGSYTITIRGTGDALAPEIAVEQPAGTNHASGDVISLGEVAVGSAQTLSFTVKNLGAGPLSLTGDPKVALSNLTNATAEVSAQPDAQVAAGGSTTFTLKVTPSAAGTFGVVLTLASDDGDEGAFTLTVSGSGKANIVDPGDGDDSGGCGCSATEGETDGSSALAALALGALVFLRRRRG